LSGEGHTEISYRMALRSIGVSPMPQATAETKTHGRDAHATKEISAFRRRKGRNYTDFARRWVGACGSSTHWRTSMLECADWFKTYVYPAEERQVGKVRFSTVELCPEISPLVMVGSW